MWLVVENSWLKCNQRNLQRPSSFRCKVWEEDCISGKLSVIGNWLFFPSHWNWLFFPSHWNSQLSVPEIRESLPLLQVKHHDSLQIQMLDHHQLKSCYMRWTITTSENHCLMSDVCSSYSVNTKSFGCSSKWLSTTWHQIRDPLLAAPTLVSQYWAHALSTLTLHS